MPHEIRLAPDKTVRYSAELDTRRKCICKGCYLKRSRPFCFSAPSKEDAMSHPTKEAVRSWLASQVKDRRPPPSPEQIRRALGWDLIAAERAQHYGKDHDYDPA